MAEQSAESLEPQLEAHQPPAPSNSNHLMDLTKPDPLNTAMDGFALCSDLPELLMYKNRLQEYTQKSSIPLPVYQTINEGVQHEPRFRSTVWVDGASYTSHHVFLHRKAAEQDVARVALDGITQKIKEEGSPLIREDTVFCKSILNEYAVKMHLEKPTYNTIRSEGLLPVFVSSLVFDGVTYTGEAGKNKKEAEQLAARAVILSILGTSDSRTVITEIIKSKVKLYAALHKVDSTQSGVNPVAVSTAGTSLAIPVNKGKDIEVSGYISNTPNTAIPYPWSGQLNIIPATHQPYIPATHQPYVPTAHQPFHEFKKPKFEPSSEAITITPPIVFVPPALGQPLAVGSSSTRKRRKKKAKKKSRVDAQLPVAVVPSSQIPSYSVAQ
ncbi:unnamed protein product [Camellia sinensis]